MTDFEKLVPELDLCKQIPTGVFDNSVLVWSYSCDKHKTEPFVEERDCIDFCRRDMVNAPPVYPAPTLQEIMMKLPDFVKYRFYEGFFYPSHPRFFPEDCADKKPVTAALKLWLKINNQKWKG